MFGLTVFSDVVVECAEKLVQNTETKLIRNIMVKHVSRREEKRYAASQIRLHPPAHVTI